MKTMKYREYRQYEGVDFQLLRSVAKGLIPLIRPMRCLPSGAQKRFLCTSNPKMKTTPSQSKIFVEGGVLDFDPEFKFDENPKSHIFREWVFGCYSKFCLSQITLTHCAKFAISSVPKLNTVRFP